MENNIYPMEEVMPIVSDLAYKYTGCDHSSVTYERAQMLMEAVLYCINEYGQGESNALLVKNVPAREAYEQGRMTVLHKRKRLQKLYNEMIMDFRDYGSVCLGDTIRQGIPAFLEKYDDKYAPQETILTLDYPILQSFDTLSGVSRVLRYVQCICLEQKFLQKMHEEYIIQSLRSYQRDYEYLLENICEVVLQNMIGHMILNKPLQETGFGRAELEELEEVLSDKTVEQIKAYAGRALERLVHQYYDGDSELTDYLSCGLLNIAARIHCNRENHCLGNIFVF